MFLSPKLLCRGRLGAGKAKEERKSLDATFNMDRSYAQSSQPYAPKDKIHKSNQKTAKIEERSTESSLPRSKAALLKQLQQDCEEHLLFGVETEARMDRDTISSIAKSMIAFMEDRNLIEHQKVVVSPDVDHVTGNETTTHQQKRAQVPNQEPLAIVGIGCRLPGDADDPESFWELLCSKGDGIVDVPQDRWSKDDLYHPSNKVVGHINVRQGGFIKDIDKFDAHFFGISPVEAMQMDPQQRLLLECSYKAFEDAGFQVEQLAGSKTGVFVGISTHDYADIRGSDSERTNLGQHTMQGGSLSIAANRVSYAFDLRGPSLSVDTACSSSLVATHLACRSLWSGESDVALVGGVNAMLKPEPHIAFNQGGFLSPDARCQAFDANANGYVRSEGCGVLVLKPLSKALEDNDHIYTTIVGSAVNEDGRTKGLAMPSSEAQVKVMTEAYRNAGINPADISYIEAHGTGTAAGDPIECKGIGNVIGGNRENPVVVGTVKTNIGHLEAGSGVAGLIKVALSMKNRAVPANLHFNQPNPKIDFDALNIKVPTELTPLPSKGHILAGINSFGFGGSNAHVVLKSAPPRDELSEPPNTEESGFPCNILMLTARCEASLKEQAAAFVKYLKTTTIPLPLICSSAATRGSLHDMRLAVAADSREKMIESLETHSNGEKLKNVYSGRASLAARPKTVFLFSGQGPQWWGMGREMMESSDVFRTSIIQIDRILRELGWLEETKSSLVKELAKDEDASRMNETIVAQPALFAIQVALTRVWNDLGVTCDAVVGHSLGEVAASWASGALSLEEATRVVYCRSKAQARAAGKGRMLAVGVSERDAISLIENHGTSSVDIAAINGPGMVTLAGETASLEEIAASLEAKGIFHRFLVVDIPFHSRLLDDIEAPFMELYGQAKCQATQIPMFSTVTAGEIEGERIDGQYWFQNIRNTVRFYPVIQDMILEDYNTFIEIAPHPILSRSVAKTFDEFKMQGVVVPSLRRHEAEGERLLLSLGALAIGGFPVDWTHVYPQANHTWAKLPNYRWQKETFWLERKKTTESRKSKINHPHLREATTFSRDSGAVVRKVLLDHRTQQYLNDHRVQGPMVFPGAGHVELLLAAGLESFGDKFGFLEDISLSKALYLPDKGEPYEIQVEIDSDEGHCVISSRKEGQDSEWTSHSRGRINHIGDKFNPPTVELGAVRQRINNPLQLDKIYSEMKEGGLHYGETFQGLEELWKGHEGESYGVINVHHSIRFGLEKFSMHPALLDTCFQAAIFTAITANTGVYLPVRIQRVKHYAKPRGLKLFTYAKTHSKGEFIHSDIWVFDENEDIVIFIQGLTCKYLKGSRGEAASGIDTFFHEYEWLRREREDVMLNRDARKYLPSPLSLSGDMDSLAQEISERPLVVKFDWAMKDFDDLVARYIFDTLMDLGLGPTVGSAISVALESRRLNIAERHDQFFNHLFLILERLGFVEMRGETAMVTRLPQHESPTAEQLNHVLKTYPEFHDEVDLLQRCGSELVGVLRGKVDPIGLIFPEANWDNIVDYYSNSASFSRYNEMMAHAVQSLLKNLPSDQVLRVVEIGARTGGMSQAVLPHLPADRTEFILTDLSPSYLARAQKRFRDFPFVEYKVLDIELQTTSQGFDLNGYDIIIASNVLHATSNLTRTIDNVKQLLAPGGIFGMLEVTRPPSSTDMIFGMTEGWWAYKDTDLRPSHCTMTAKKWTSFLEENDFTDVLSVNDVVNGQPSPQSCIIGRGPADMQEICNKDTTTENRLSQKENGLWLLFQDQRGVARALSKKLQKAGHECLMVSSGSAFSAGSGNFVMRADNRDDMKKLLDHVYSSATELSGIVHCWSLDVELSEGEDAPTTIPEEGIANACCSSINLLSEIVQLSLETKPACWFVTSGAETPENDAPVNIWQSPIWGTFRSAANEFPDVQMTLSDLSATPREDEVDQLVDEMLAPTPSVQTDEVAFRGMRRYAHKLSQLSPDTMQRCAKRSVPTSGGSYALSITESGMLENLVLRERARPQLEPHEIRIDVKASALNFRDLMFAMGLLGDEIIKDTFLGSGFGLECSGVISEVGSDVTNFEVGDEVVGVAAGSIGGQAVTSAELAYEKPKYLSFEEGACIPVALITAYYGLVTLARMSEEDIVLIHAGSGGVGVAAIRLAQTIGCQKIIATAGTEEKRAFLREQGVHHVFDSRTTAFRDGIMEATEGRGVDIVLNSLSGDKLTQSIRCLASYGRFVEIGKTDIYQNKRVGLRPFANNLSYFAVDVDRILKQKPTYSVQLFREAMKFWFQNMSNPLPSKVFSVSECQEAFRFMAQAKHIGKVVLSMNEPSIEVLPHIDLTFEAEGTYLVVGGCRGYGLALAKRMADRGAKHLVLVSRSGVRDAADQRLIDRMVENGSEVRVAKVDVTDYVALKALLADVERTLPPLKGVIQSSVALEDCMCSMMTKEKFIRPLLPKIKGTWNLHRATESHDLEFFVSFSSIASMYGTLAQSNYAAANAFLDKFAHYRRFCGLAGSTLSLGELGDVGFVSRNEYVHEILGDQGWKPMPIAQSTQVFERILTEQPVHRAAFIVDWKQLEENLPRGATVFKFAHLFKATDSSQCDKQDKFLDLLMAANNKSNRYQMLHDALREAIARIMSLASGKLDVRNSIMKMGLDSLMANQVRSWISSTLGLDYSLMLIMQGPSVEELTDQLLEQLAEKSKQ